MTWEYTYDGEADETTFRWVGESTTKSTTVSGEIEQLRNGYPVKTDAREAIADMIQQSGSPKQIRMLFDLNYGFEQN